MRLSFSLCLGLFTGASLLLPAAAFAQSTSASSVGYGYSSMAYGYSSTSSVGSQAPIAADDEFSVPAGKTVHMDPLMNDFDPDDDWQDLTITAVTTPDHGTLSMQSDGTLLYVADANYTGTDDFSYTVSDGALTDTAVVMLNVLAANARDPNFYWKPTDGNNWSDTDNWVDAVGAARNDTPDQVNDAAYVGGAGAYDADLHVDTNTAIESLRIGQKNYTKTVFLDANLTILTGILRSGTLDLGSGGGRAAKTLHLKLIMIFGGGKITAPGAGTPSVFKVYNPNTPPGAPAVLLMQDAALEMSARLEIGSSRTVNDGKLEMHFLKNAVTMGNAADIDVLSGGKWINKQVVRAANQGSLTLAGVNTNTITLQGTFLCDAWGIIKIPLGIEIKEDLALGDDSPVTPTLIVKGGILQVSGLTGGENAASIHNAGGIVEVYTSSEPEIDTLVLTALIATFDYRQTEGFYKTSILRPRLHESATTNKVTITGNVKIEAENVDLAYDSPDAPMLLPYLWVEGTWTQSAGRMRVHIWRDETILGRNYVYSEDQSVSNTVLDVLTLGSPVPNDRVDIFVTPMAYSRSISFTEINGEPFESGIYTGFPSADELLEKYYTIKAVISI